MGARGPAGPDDETVLRAWDMRVKGKSPAYIAEAFKVSVATAHRYVKAGRELAQVIEYTEATDVHKVIHVRAERERSAAALDLVQEWMADYVDAGGDTVQAAVVVLKAEERRAKLLGLDAATRVRLTTDQAGRDVPAPPPHVQRAIEEYQGDVVDGEVIR